MSRSPSAASGNVRLIGIDAPKRGACYSGQATAAARQLALGKSVRLLGDGTQAARDRYSRLLAYVTLPGAKELGRELIAGGFGLVYVYDCPFARLASYRSAERNAKGASFASATASRRSGWRR